MKLEGSNKKAIAVVQGRESSLVWVAAVDTEEIRTSSKTILK